MNTTLPPSLEAKLTPSLPRPKFREWANKTGTPWEVYFPKQGSTPAKRRFFSSPEDAVTEIVRWSKDRKPDAVLGKRSVDDVLWAESILPAGVTIRDAVRYYLEHNSSSSKLTLGEIVKMLRDDLAKQKKSPAYQKNIEYASRHLLAELGADTLVSTLHRSTLLRFVKAGAEFWDRFARKRIASLVCSRAVELDIIKPANNPMLGFPTEKEPKKSVHALSNGDTQIILDYFLDHYPQYLPAVALQLFAGIRTEELCRAAVNGKRPLDWADIDFGVRINVPVEVSKTHEPREIEFWSEALTNWLTPFRRKSGPVLECPEGVDPSKFDFATIKSNILADLNAERAEEKLAPVDFQKNDFRHTFASNCVAFHQSFAVAQLCLGHTNQNTIKRYRTHRDRAASTAYFSSKPTRHLDNVVALSA